MSHSIHHVHLVKELTEMLGPVFSKSPQAIYLYLDDQHKSCNKKFSDLVGYKSPEEWAKNEFPVSDIDEKDRDKVINAYMEASRKFKATNLTAMIDKKDGKKVKVNIVMVPLSYQKEVFVLHFISKA